MTEILRTSEEEEIRQTFVQDLSKYLSLIPTVLYTMTEILRTRRSGRPSYRT